jgi:nitrate reductase NapE component
MKSGNARNELGFVLGLSLVGLILVLAVAFVPWYGAVVLALGH